MFKLFNFVTTISITSMPSVGSLSDTQLSILKACSTGEPGEVQNLDGLKVEGLKFRVEPRLRV
jgi:hypothetical protein